jgi:ABC-type lipoprotein export system ATPase subunit/multidrug efflux pump subunit AcrA (membrane-fusion protein)
MSTEQQAVLPLPAPGAMRVPSLVARDLSKGFTTGKQTHAVIKNVSLELFASELTLLVGPSGCGKSVLMALLGGLLRPGAGGVSALGVDLGRLDERAIERFRLAYVGFVFQNFNLFASLTALEQVLLVLQYAPQAPAHLPQAALTALGQVGLEAQAGLRPMELSGGQKQRVAIARALVKHPAFIFADEPTSALDGPNGQVVITLLKRIAHEQGATVLCVTHDHRLFEHADRILYLEDGRLVGDERRTLPRQIVQVPPQDSPELPLVMHHPTPSSSRRYLKRIALAIFAAIALSALYPFEPTTSSSGEGSESATTPTDGSGLPSNYLAMSKGRVDVEGGLIRLAAQRDGVVDEVLVEEGDSVQKGQRLLTLKQDAAQLGVELAQQEVAQAEAAIELLQVRSRAASREAKRLEAALPHAAVTRADYDQARDQVTLLAAELKKAQAELEISRSRLRLARYELERSVVRAPLEGEIVKRTARPGDGVSSLNVTPLFLFAPATPRIVRAEVEDRFVERIKPGMTAEIVPEAEEGKVLRGRVLRIGRVFGQPQPTDDPAQRQDMRVVECVLSLEGGELLIGQRVLVRFLKS